MTFPKTEIQTAPPPTRVSAIEQSAEIPSFRHTALRRPFNQPIRRTSVKSVLYPAALLLAACAAAPAESGSPAAAQPQTQSAAPLEGGWRVVRIGQSALPADASLAFDPARLSFSGTAGCNRLFGGYTETAGRLEFADIASTRMLCKPALMKREQAMTDALQHTASYVVDGDRLVLSDAKKQLLLKAVRADVK